MRGAGVRCVQGGLASREGSCANRPMGALTPGLANSGQNHGRSCTASELRLKGWLKKETKEKNMQQRQ